MMDIDEKERKIFTWIGGKSPDPQRILILAEEIIEEKGDFYTPFSQKLWNQMTRKGLLRDLLNFAFKHEKLVFLKEVTFGQFDRQQDPLVVFLEHEKLMFADKMSKGLASEHDYWDEKWPFFEDVLDVLKRKKNNNIYFNPKPVLDFLSVCGHVGINRRLVHDYTPQGLGIFSTTQASNIDSIPHADVFFNWWDSGLDWKSILLVSKNDESGPVPADFILWKSYYKTAEKLGCLIPLYEKIYEGEENKPQAIKILIKLNMGAGTDTGNQASLWLRQKMIELDLHHQPYWDNDFIEINGRKVEKFMQNEKALEEKYSFQRMFEYKINKNLLNQLKTLDLTLDKVKKVQDVAENFPKSQPIQRF